MPANRPAPADLAEVAAKLTRNQARTHYRASGTVLDRWCEEQGVSFLPPHANTARPIPDDFATVAPTLCIAALARRYGCSIATIGVWLAKTGITPGRSGKATANHGKAKDKRPIPDDFVVHAKKMSQRDLTRHYQVSYKVLRRWLAETGVKRPTPVPKKSPVPADFVQHMYDFYLDLVERYGVSRHTIGVWRHQSGWVKPVAAKPVEFVRQPAPRPAAGPVTTWGQARSPGIVPPRDNSRVGQAKDHLRRIGYQNVYDRGAVLGRKHEGTFQVGGLVMREAEMIELAMAKGMREWV